MKTFIQRYILTFIGIATGALAGYLYWKYIGCVSGTCAITSKPLNSTLYGALIGGLLLSMFEQDKKRTTHDI